YRIVYNLSLNKIQSNKSTSQLTDLYEDEIAENSITDTLCSEENSRIIERLIFSLRPTYSAVLNMFYFEHLSCEEIAEIMQIEVNNVKVLLYRSRKALRDLIIEKKLQEDII
ncbi:MAG: RNA polymerase sigma factor, partial [Ignavibacteria bacterium]|nr:RNA polymerase sigma factor [Ignavibacteria bacterium]